MLATAVTEWLSAEIVPGTKKVAPPMADSKGPSLTDRISRLELRPTSSCQAYRSVMPVAFMFTVKTLPALTVVGAITFRIGLAKPPGLRTLERQRRNRKGLGCTPPNREELPRTFGPALNTEPESCACSSADVSSLWELSFFFCRY